MSSAFIQYCFAPRWQLLAYKHITALIYDRIKMVHTRLLLHKFIGARLIPTHKSPNAHSFSHITFLLALLMLGTLSLSLTRTYTTRTWLCCHRVVIDINECLEQTADCDPSVQLCLNTRGSFHCRDRAHETCMPGFELDEEFRRCQGHLAALFTAINFLYKCFAF